MSQAIHMQRSMEDGIDLIELNMRKLIGSMMKVTIANVIKGLEKSTVHEIVNFQKSDLRMRNSLLGNATKIYITQDQINYIKNEEVIKNAIKDKILNMGSVELKPSSGGKSRAIRTKANATRKRKKYSGGAETGNEKLIIDTIKNKILEENTSQKVNVKPTPRNNDDIIIDAIKKKILEEGVEHKNRTTENGKYKDGILSGLKDLNGKRLYEYILSLPKKALDKLKQKIKEIGDKLTNKENLEHVMKVVNCAIKRVFKRLLVDKIRKILETEIFMNKEFNAILSKTITEELEKKGPNFFKKSYKILYEKKENGVCINPSLEGIISKELGDRNNQNILNPLNFVNNIGAVRGTLLSLFSGKKNISNIAKKDNDGNQNANDNDGNKNKTGNMFTRFFNTKHKTRKNDDKERISDKKVKNKTRKSYNIFGTKTNDKDENQDKDENSEDVEFKDNPIAIDNNSVRDPVNLDDIKLEITDNNSNNLEELKIKLKTVKEDLRVAINQKNAAQGRNKTSDENTTGDIPGDKKIKNLTDQFNNIKKEIAKLKKDQK